MHNTKNRMFNKPAMSVIAGAILVCGIQSAHAEAFNWEGPYAGLSMGAQKTEYDWKTTDYVFPDGTPVPLGFTGSMKESLDSNDFLFDLYGGYNWTITPQVILGAEIHARYAHAGDTQQVPGVDLGSIPDAGYTSVEAKTNWSGDLRGRLGYLFQPELLVYTTAGVAYTQLDTTVTCPADTNVCNPSFGTIRNSDSQNATGWLAGIGLETTLTDNLTARIEYLYTDYGTVDVDGLPAIDGESFGFNGDVDLTTQALSAGLAYKF